VTKTAAARRERFLPYPYARAGIDLTITSCRLDGTAEIPSDAEARLLELDVPWNRADLGLAVRVPRDIVARVMPSDEPAQHAEVVIVVRCAATFVRRAVRVPLTAVDAPVGAALDLFRDDLAGSAYVTAYLVRRSALPSGSRYATVRGARLADSRPWELRADRTREPRGEYLEVRYRRFSDDKALPARDRGNLHVLQFDQEAPVLWINADHERVAAVLNSRGTVGRQARLREVVFDPIAHAVWTQLFLKAASTYVRDEEATYPWEDGVLDLLLKDVFPEVRNAADRRDRLLATWDDFPTLLQRLDAALQRRNDLAGHLSKLIEEEDGP
jgi:hypothetical protein